MNQYEQAMEQVEPVVAGMTDTHLVIGAHYGWVRCSCDPDRHLSMTEFNTHLRDTLATQVEEDA